ncbi:M14 family zinc carboxypeptidase [Alkalihalobacterium alkalinitrilicum]|uniref:M14 family zinc carboxypeptidase n=1 Tax=Alkalihalobacterium alkalinitrilicum TaxID=427920 RepID=UPI000994A4D3|nr:M14 family zinc carboxypeptidase [Alkalihalobacterium alkalinitrilicum]
MFRRKVIALIFIFSLITSLIPVNTITFASTSNIVNKNQVYSYEQMTNDIKRLAQRYPNIMEYRSLGKSTYGREIWAVKLGNGDANVFINASHHAREWGTTNVVMTMIDQYAQAHSRGQNYQGYNVRDLLSKTTIWFVPMVNPDGVTLQQRGLSAFPSHLHSSLITMNAGSRDFGRWKADARGIDPNRQYPAKWSTIRNNPGRPYYSNFKGTQPLQTPETRLVADFTYQINPEIAVAYHSTGNIIYWHFHNRPENVNRDRAIANQFSNITGYTLVQPTSNPSGGGYTDWFIQEFGRPGFTPEICSYIPENRYAGSHQAILNCINDAWDRNKSIGLFIANEGHKLWANKTSNINEKITLLETTRMYNQPLEQTRIAAKINPQAVTAFQRQGSWYRINTWLGPKWIKPTNAIVGEIQAVDKEVRLTENAYLHNQPLASSRRSEVLRPQTVRAFEEWNGWYRINTWVGPKWIRPNNAIVGEVKQVDETIRLSEDTRLHNLPSTNHRRSEIIRPQTVRAFEEWNGWYHINTWVGPKWIKPNHAIIGDVNSIDERITLTSNTHLHNHPFTNHRRSDIVRPQTVRAFEEWNGWYRINTWLGPKWIKPTDAIIGEINAVDEQLTLTSNTHLHNHPFDTHRRSEVVRPQTVRAFEEWNGWYRINTWLGPKWIKPSDAMIGEITSIDERLTLTRDAHLHNHPFDNHRRSELLRPQTVQAFEEWNGWYRINTWLGPKWIKPENVMIGEIRTIDEAITLTESTYLHNDPFENTRRNEQLDPQTVQAFEEWNGWYRINTWIGPKWIKP